MEYAIIANINQDTERMAFDSETVKQILPCEMAKIFISHDGQKKYISYNNKIFKIVGDLSHSDDKLYFIILNNSEALHVNDYKILHDIEKLPGNVITGFDDNGKKHHCAQYLPGFS